MLPYIPQKIRLGVPPLSLCRKWFICLGCGGLFNNYDDVYCPDCRYAPGWKDVVESIKEVSCD